MTNFDAVKDSGERRSFSTGSVRDKREGKGRFDLITPIALRRLAKHYENGAVKYGDRNWELGQPMSSYYDSAARHMNNYLEGERDEDHLAAAMWNVAAMLHTEEMVQRGLAPAELNDMPDYTTPVASEPRSTETVDVGTGLPHWDAIPLPSAPANEVNIQPFSVGRDYARDALDMS